MNNKTIALWSMNPTWTRYMERLLWRRGYETKEIMSDAALDQYEIVLTDKIWHEHEVMKIIKEKK